MTKENNLPPPINLIDVIKIDQGKKLSTKENVITESSVSLSVNGEEWFSFLCTPLDLEALAIGFLFTSQIITTKEEISSLKLCANGSGVDVWLGRSVEKPRLWQRNSGCSGGVSVPGIKLRPLTADERFRLSTEEIGQILVAFYANQQLYQSSGGVHTSALFSSKTLVYKAEDIGRHNTLDKIAGKMLASSSSVQRPILVTTGRISLEMMQKAAVMRAGFVISRTSPTTASVELAQQLGVTLIGYAEPNAFKVYSHPEQILDL